MKKRMEIVKKAEEQPDAASPVHNRIKRLSRWQTGTLRYIRLHGKVRLATLEKVAGPTLNSLLYNGWLVADDESAWLSQAGVDEIDSMFRPELRKRSTFGPLTEHCQRLLREARRRTKVAG